MKLLFLKLFLLGTLLSSQALASNFPSFDFKDWPPELVKELKSQFPQLMRKTYTEQELNDILKQIHKKMSFENLSIVYDGEHLFLVGTVNSKIDRIEFDGLKDLTTEEATETLNLSLTDAQNENKVRAAQEKLLMTYRNLGYRKATGSYKYETVDSVNRKLVFTVKVGPKTLISEISFSGLPKFENKNIQDSLYWNAVGKILSDENLRTINNRLRQALSQNGYYLVNTPSPQIIYSADETRARLNYKAQPQTKYRVEITGSQTNSDYYLQTEVLKLDEYYSSESNFGAELSEKLRSFYILKGYPHIEVPYYERKEGSTIILTLNVEQGPFVEIHQINFLGNYSRSEKFYVEKLKELSSARIQANMFVRADIEQGVQNLIVYLQNEGFISAKLTRLQIGTDKSKSNRGIVVVQIEEGAQTQVEKIQFVNNKAFSSAELAEIFTLKENAPLNLYELEKALNTVKVYYADRGYIEAKITNEQISPTQSQLIKYSDDFGRAQLNIVLHEGPQIKVGSILIEGTSLTHDKLVLTELDFKVGDLLTPSKLEESIARLQRTGHFSTIDIYTLEANTTVSDRSVVVRVVERNPGLFTFGGGITNENRFTAHAYTGIAYRNLGGWGRGASLRLEGSYNPDILRFFEHKFIFGFLEPYLFETRARFRVNATRSQTVTDVSIRKVTELNSAVWSAEQDFSSHITGIWEILNVATYVDRGISREDEIKYKYERDDLVIASTGPTVDFDYRDNLLNPTKGSLSRLSFEYADSNLGGHKVDNFVRVTGSTTHYLPFHEGSVIWANSLRAGWVNNVDNYTYGIPFDKKGFILGGRTTIRGFESTEFFPSTTNTELNYVGTNFKLRTFSTFQLVKSELRFPLWQKYDMMGAVFYDGGEVDIDGVAFTDRWRDSIGIGFRYNTPVGPLNLEYAQKLDRKSSESEGAFHLSVGVF